VHHHGLLEIDPAAQKGAGYMNHWSSYTVPHRKQNPGSPFPLPARVAISDRSPAAPKNLRDERVFAGAPSTPVDPVHDTLASPHFMLQLRRGKLEQPNGPMAQRGRAREGQVETRMMDGDNHRSPVIFACPTTVCTARYFQKKEPLTPSTRRSRAPSRPHG
jgi:hypothetical protein